MGDPKEFTPKGEAEIRQQVVEDYGLDENNEANKPFIEKAVKKELDIQAEKLEFSKKQQSWEQERIENEKKLSKAIEQKAKWRDEAKKALELDEPTAKPNPTQEPAAPVAPANNEEISALKNKLASLEERQQRKDYSHMTDEEYNAINNLAKADGKSFEETMTSNPLAKSYLETNKVNQRNAGVSMAPSTRTSTSTSMSFEEVDLENPDHEKWLKSEPKRFEEYSNWLRNGGMNNFTK